MTDVSNRPRRSDGWQLEGNSADAYERYLVPGMFAPWAEELVEHAALEPGNHALDVGCGTGIVARRAARAVGPEGRVVGLDVNEGMLDTARDVSSDLQPAIEWQKGTATDLPFSGRAFDVAFCQQVLQFVPEPSSALREMYRVLVLDGRLALTVWRLIEFNPAYAVLADVLERHAGEEAAAMMRSPFSNWDVDDLRDLVEDAGFREASVTIGVGSMRYPSIEEFVRREAASSPLAEPLQSVDRDVRAALIEDAGQALRAYRDDEGIVFPMQTYLLMARR